jgi:hypothetical protein
MEVLRLSLVAASGLTWYVQRNGRAIVLFKELYMLKILLKNILLRLNEDHYQKWSIGLMYGTSPFDLNFLKSSSMEIISSCSLGLEKTTFGVADPFMLKKDDNWYLFFEVINRPPEKGSIGVAKSTDLITWEYQGIVLNESFHLSYPQVIYLDHSYYMIPECKESGSLRLYRSSAFPSGWEFELILVNRPLGDPTIFFYEKRWWMLAHNGFLSLDEMVIYHAEKLTGPWFAHDRNPIYTNDRIKTRCAGRVISYNGQLIRFAQDYSKYYGHMVNAYLITEITPSSYKEMAIDPRPLLGPGNLQWNRRGMHHIDIHKLDEMNYVACVDGQRLCVDRYLP